MSQILTPSQVNQPRLVTLAELRAKLLPLVGDDAWGRSTIVDLWTKGAPVPVNPGEPERRILLPKQFQLWFEDVAQRRGLDTTNAYGNVAKTLRTSAGQTITLRTR